MSRKRILIILLVLVLSGIGVMLYRGFNPSVLQFSPADNSTDVPRDSAIEIRFSRPMQPESVLDRLNIYPTVKGEYTWEGTTLRFQPEEDWPQGVKVRITLVSGALTDWNMALEDYYGWSFTIRRTRLAYLFPADEPADLFALDPISGDIEQLTSQAGVLDFDIFPTRNLVYYSAANKNNGSDLYSLDIITADISSVLDCQQDTCSNVQISPDGTTIAFIRIDQDGGTSVDLLDLIDGEERQLSPTNHQVRLPQWSPNGWLNYYDSTLQAYQIIDLETGDVISLENQTGELGSWSPTGKKFLVQELTPLTTDILRGPIGEASNTQVNPETLKPVVVASGNILSFDPAADIINNLSGRDDVEDADPVFSPGGRLVAFARRILDEKGEMLGRQLWLMRSDGSEQEALTTDLNYKYSAFTWHPEGHMLAAVRVDNTVITDPPELWLVKVPSGEAIRLVIGAYAPEWIP